MYYLFPLNVVYKTWNNKIAMLKDPVRSFGCQFVYRGTLGGICMIQINIHPALSPADREPSICISRNSGCYLQGTEQQRSNFEPASPRTRDLAQEPVIQKVTKYGMRVVYTNLLPISYYTKFLERKFPNMRVFL
jgi:hypothetical protein